METLLSVSIVVVLVMWAGLALATFLGRIVSDLLPFGHPGNGGVEVRAAEESEDPPSAPEKMVA